jgi:chromosome segregation ATPase
MNVATVGKNNVEEEMISEFEGKLSEARRQTALAVEEYDAASDRWKAERRRLNNEIDRLEAALAEAKIAPKRALREKQTPAVDVSETPALKVEVAALHERLRESSAQWEMERGRLKEEIARLERAVADLIERSNNPMRTAQAAIDRLETQMREAMESRNNLETELSSARAQWEGERLKLAGELFRVRRSAGPAAADPASAEELRRARAEIEQLERRLAESRGQVSGDLIEQLRTQYAEKIREIAGEKTRLAADLESATALLDRERQRFAAAAAAPAAADPTAASADDGRAAVRDEVERVEGKIAEIERLIDDPESELADVIRKNLERGEMAAYLKGIRFALGESREAP